MTPQQQARLGEVMVLVGTAQELLQQAKAATYANGMIGVVSVTARTAIADALNDTNIAVGVLLPLVQAQEVVHE